MSEQAINGRKAKRVAELRKAVEAKRKANQDDAESVSVAAKHSEVDANATDSEGLDIDFMDGEMMDENGNAVEIDMDYEDQSDQAIVQESEQGVEVNAVKNKTKGQAEKGASADKGEEGFEFDDVDLLSDQEFADLKIEALARLGKEERRIIKTLLPPKDKMLWNFFFMYIFGAQSASQETIERIQSLEAIIKVAEDQAEQRKKENDATVKALEQAAMEAEQRVHQYHKKQVAYVISNTAAKIGEGVSANIQDVVTTKTKEALKEVLKDKAVPLVTGAFLLNFSFGAFWFLAAMMWFK